MFMKQKNNYAAEALKLGKAIDIAIKSIKKYRPDDSKDEQTNYFLNAYSEWKYSVLNPAPEYRNLASLKYQVDNVFTFFQEANGEIVEYFWKQISKENLGYLRKDRLRNIINRGKIKGRVEYELVVDLLVVAEQEGRISAPEARLLSDMIGDFENQNK